MRRSEGTHARCDDDLREVSTGGQGTGQETGWDLERLDCWTAPTVVRRRATLVVVRLRYREQTFDRCGRLELILSYPATDGCIVETVLAPDGLEVIRREQLVVDSGMRDQHGMQHN